MAVLLIIIAIIVVVALFAAYAFNKLRRLDIGAQEALGGIDVQLTRRADLIPNLVNTVKGYAQHEKGVFEEVTRARAGIQAAAAGDDVPAKAAADAELTQSLVNLNAVAEAYPDLKANQNFLGLQNELSSTEDRIANGRRYYNATVRELNTKVESVPSNIVAGFGKIEKADYFEAEDQQVRAAPQISFGSSGPGVSFGGRSAPSAVEPGAPEPGSPEYGSPPR
ncbi:MAG: LemA family protein [Aeromicrobium sp.]